MKKQRSFWNSEAAVAYLARQFGAVDYDNWQVLPFNFWSFVPYTTTGATQFTFFSDALGANSVNYQLTNMPKAASFGGQHLLLKQIACGYFCPDPDIDGFDGTDASTLYSDFVNGLFQAGVFELKIQNKVYAQFPKPFLYAGGDYAPDRLYYAGMEALTLSDGTPNTVLTYLSHGPHATLNHNSDQKYLVDPNILIEAEQVINVRINYESGALAPIATDIISSSTAFYIGVNLMGLLIRPVQ